jgi:myosin-5
MEATTMNIIVGYHVWVEDRDTTWVDGQVTKVNGEKVEVQTTTGKKVRIPNQLVFLIMTMSNGK